MKRLNIVVGFSDEDGKVLITEQACDTWTLNTDDFKHDNEFMRSEVSSIFKEQLKIDLDNKDIMRLLVDRIFESEWIKK